jgi:hypothetical protein
MESINILHDDHTYVYGNMMAKKVDGNFVEPYYYYGAPEINDSDDCITYYYPSINRFIVYHNDVLIRIVNTCTSWSDDYDKYEIEDNKISKITMTEHGMNRCYITCENGFVSDIKFTRKNFGIGNIKLNGPAPKLESIG